MASSLVVLGIIGLIAFLVWLTPNLAGATWRRVRNWTFLVGVVILAGFVVPPLAIAFGLLGGWVFDSVALARVIMGIGILVGLVMKVVVGIAAAAIANFLFDAFRSVFRRSTREDVGEILEGYAGALSWVLLAEELCWIFAPYVPLWVLFLGVLVGATIVSMTVGWNLPIAWGRRFAFQFQVVLLIVIFGIAVRGFYEREYFFARADRAVVVYARDVEAERERAIRTAEVAAISVRLVDPRSSPAYREAAKRGFRNPEAERVLVEQEYRRAREELRSWEDRGHPKPIRWLRAAWREVIE